MTPRNDFFGSADTVAMGAATTPPEGPVTQGASIVGEVIAGRYRILRLLGQGGMGSVYMARDHELDDIIALKTIRSANELAINRIRREVKLARRVTHRNVARTFEIGEHSGGRFLTMEYIDGEPLSALLRERGRLTTVRAIAILRAVCSALGAAHSAGVIHRDIKPDNVMIGRDGRVVVTDFGIAVGSGGHGSGALGPIGTPAYMSPEQLESGDTTIASDIYSAGVMAYELFTGELPWSTSNAELNLERLTEPAPDPRSAYPELSERIAQVISRALARSPEQRFPTITAFGTAFTYAEPSEVIQQRREVRTPASDTPDSQQVPRNLRRKTGVAVLPFTSHGADTDDDMVAGFVEELIDALCSVRELRVLSRGAMAKFERDELEAHEIGSRLNVDLVIEGSMRRSAGSLRLTARAIRVEDQVQLWAERLTIEPHQLLAIPDQLVDSLTAALELGSKASKRDANIKAEAVDLYLRARKAYRDPGKQESLELFTRAQSLAPDNPLINAGLAMSLVRRWFLSDADTGQFVERAREAAERAMAHGPTLGEPHLALALLHYNLGENERAAQEARTALAKAPSCAEAHELIGRILYEMGRLQEGRRRFEVARGLGHGSDLLNMPILRAAALEGDWDYIDQTFGDTKMSAVMGRLVPARVFAYREDNAALRAHKAELEESRAHDGDGVTLLAKLLVDIFLGEAQPSSLYMLIQPDNLSTTSTRRLAYGFQLRAEVAGFAGDEAVLMQSLLAGETYGLFDLHWLDKCPLLDSARQSPEFHALRDRIAERCHRIYDAMWN